VQVSSVFEVRSFRNETCTNSELRAWSKDPSTCATQASGSFPRRPLACGCLVLCIDCLTHLSDWISQQSNSMEHSPSSEGNITQLIKTFHAFYGTRKFITSFKRARHWHLSQSPYWLCLLWSFLFFSVSPSEYELALWNRSRPSSQANLSQHSSQFMTTLLSHSEPCNVHSWNIVLK
jgi:hypothetical protein